MASGQVSGFLIIDKPKGITSHDVVARVRKLSGQRKVGHTGTLDPMATGVLLVGLGQATRLIEYMVTSRKQYCAVIRFGVSTNTHDAEGEVTTKGDVSTLTEPDIKAALPQFTGEIQQIPPIFSAIKQDGRPLYKRARAGETVEVSPRSVSIYNLDWVNWETPDLTLNITCSSGTYIRSLARDLGQAVKTGAHLAGLTRTANGQWTLQQAVSLQTLENAGQSNWKRFLNPPDQAILHLPNVHLNSEQEQHIIHGRQIELTPTAAGRPADNQAPPELLRAYTSNGRFLAILQSVNPQENNWKPKKVFLA
jgi:tRNA pseudouridine55 synthase